MSNEIVKLRWVVEEDGKRRLQTATIRSWGRNKYYHWEDVEEVPAAEEYADHDKPIE